MFIDKVKDNFVNRDLKVSKLNSIFKRKIYSLEPLKTKVLCTCGRAKLSCMAFSPHDKIAT